MLSKNADFEYQLVEVDNVNIGVMRIKCAVSQPVTFQKTEYIRVGSYTKKLRDYPPLQSRLWSRLHNTHFEDLPVQENLSLDKALQLLDFSVYFDLSGIPQPGSSDSIAHYLMEEGIILRQDNGLYAITNLGAILFAKRLADFSKLARKAVRVVQYNNNNRLEMLREDVGNKGYAVGFEGLMKYIEALIPAQELITSALREKKLLTLFWLSGRLLQMHLYIRIFQSPAPAQQLRFSLIVSR